MKTSRFELSKFRQNWKYCPAEGCGYGGARATNCPEHKLGGVDGKTKLRIEEAAGIKENARRDDELEASAERKIKSFLQEDRPQIQSLGCGFHDGVYYFGTKVYRDSKAYAAVITSDRRMFIKFDDNDEIKNVFGLKYKDNFFDKSIDNLFAREAIQKFLFGDTESITLEAVYFELKSLFKRYAYFEDERKYSLLACYRIAGFFMPIWRARARLFIYGEPGSAKSRLTNMLHSLGFNSVALGDWTLPYIQRIIESTRGETHIDDFETLDDEKKMATIRLYKVGYMRGFKAGKVKDGTVKEPEVFDLFNSMSLNNTEGLDFISSDRSITLRIPKVEMKEYAAEPNPSDECWKLLRDKLYIVGLKYADEVAREYETIGSDRLGGRALSIVKPELTIARMISESVFREVESFIVDELEQNTSLDLENNVEFLTLRYAYKFVIVDGKDSRFSVEDVRCQIMKEMKIGDDDKRQKHSISTQIGAVFSRSPIFKKTTPKGYRHYHVKPEDLMRLLKAKRYFNVLLDMFGQTQGKLGSTSSSGSIGSTGSTLTSEDEKKGFTSQPREQVERVEPEEPFSSKPVDKEAVRYD